MYIHKMEEKAHRCSLKYPMEYSFLLHKIDTAQYIGCNFAVDEQQNGGSNAPSSASLKGSDSGKFLMVPGKNGLSLSPGNSLTIYTKKVTHIDRDI